MKTFYLIISFLPFVSLAQIKSESNAKDTAQAAKLIASDYIDNYLMRLDSNELYTKKNIEFIRLHIQDSKSKAFELFYQQGDKIDDLMGQKGYAREEVKYIIAKEDIDPVVLQAAKDSSVPDWNRLASIVKRKYNDDYSDRVIIDAMIRWYGYKKDWQNYCKYVISRVEKYGAYGVLPNEASQLNALAWDLFLHSNNQDELMKALAWSDRAIELLRSNAEYLDTNANLLYKIGKKQEAIEKEKTAARMQPAAKDISQNLDKMQNGLPTWPNK
jgi:hypothetical protein